MKIKCKSCKTPIHELETKFIIRTSKGAEIVCCSVGCIQTYDTIIRHKEGQYGDEIHP